MDQYISDSTKYRFGNQVISLPIFLNELPKDILIEETNLFLRSSFHVTLVAIGEIIRKHAVTIPDFELNLIQDFCDYVKKNPIEFIGFKNEYRFVSENERRSIVAMCNISNLEGFFNLLNTKYNLNIEVPPTHVTIYTLQPNKGIFLTDSSDIQKLTKIVTVPGLTLSTI